MPDTPGFLLNTPKRALGRQPRRGTLLDVLSDTLRVIRLSGAIFCGAEFTAPYAIESPPPPHLAARLLPAADCLSIFHVLAEGECWVVLDGETPLHAGQG